MQEAFTEGKDETQWLKGMYDDMKNRARPVALPPFDMFWQSNNYVRFPVPEANKQWVRFADYRDNPLLNPLGTPSGKIEIYSDAIAKMHYEDCPGIPTGCRRTSGIAGRKRQVSAVAQYRAPDQPAALSARQHAAAREIRGSGS